MATWRDIRRQNSSIMPSSFGGHRRNALRARLIFGAPESSETGKAILAKLLGCSRFIPSFPVADPKSTVADHGPWRYACHYSLRRSRWFCAVV